MCCAVKLVTTLTLLGNGSGDVFFHRSMQRLSDDDGFDAWVELLHFWSNAHPEIERFYRPPDPVGRFPARKARLKRCRAPRQVSSRCSNGTPPPATTRFEEERVRAASINGRVCLAVSAALKDCALSRAEVAQRMSAYLGERVSEPMLNAYASQGRDDKTISLTRFVALLHVTRDRRLLEMIAEQFGWAVIDRKYLPLIDLAAVQERRDELGRHADALRDKPAREARCEPGEGMVQRGRDRCACAAGCPDDETGRAGFC